MGTTWHFGTPQVPARLLVISMLALAVPVISSLGGEPTAAGRYEVLLWLLALIPGFLLAYYRGWSGIAIGLAAAMAVFSVAQVYLVATGQRPPDWPYLLAITGTLLFLSLVGGEVTNQLHEAREQAERLALIDEMTYLPNRRYFEMALEREYAAAQRGRNLVVVAFDLDGLKAVNDTYGHAAGDQALAAFANVLKANTRSMNLSARLGGDEFVSIVSDSTIEGALVFAERVQEAVRKLDGLASEISVSAGLAAYRKGMTTPALLVEAADRALYEAKAAPGSVSVARGVPDSGLRETPVRASSAMGPRVGQSVD